MKLTETVYGGGWMNERFFALPEEKQQAIGCFLATRISKVP